MIVVEKIRRVSWLLACVLLVTGGVLSASAQDQTGQPATQSQSPSTQDLEAQPNTNQYPGAGRRQHRGIQPGSRPADPPANDPPPSPDPTPSNTANPAPPPNQAPPVTAPRNSVRATPVPGPQNFPPQNTMIGPPAPVPLTPEQMAPVPPKVSYENGLLSVESTNARLSDILNAIRARTGIQFEGLSPGQEKDRVAGKFGPAPADQVLTSLLQGSHFDYVIIGMPENPSLVQRVILTPTSGAVAAAPGAQPVQRAESDDDDDSGDDSSAEPSNQTQGAQQPPAQGAQFPGRGPKSAEQLLNELKQMQQQAQQNQQQQQNQPQDSPNRPPTPH
jgi:hypothetical protein